MKHTAFIRKMDSLHRLTIPQELCTKFGLDNGSPMEFLVDGNGIYLRPYEAAEDADQALDRLERTIRDGYLTDEQTDKILKYIRDMRKIVKEEV